jgi:hypothetical protein
MADIRARYGRLLRNVTFPDRRHERPAIEPIDRIACTDVADASARLR